MAKFVVVIGHASGRYLEVVNGLRSNGVALALGDLAAEQEPQSHQIFEYLTVGANHDFRQFKFQHSGKTWDVIGGVKSTGAVVVQWNMHNPPMGHQMFSVNVIADAGVNRIIASHSGLALSVAGGSVERGAAVIQWPFQNVGHFQWRVQDVDGG